MSLRRSVEYLLVAEFDIDKGPTISHQYPEPLSSDVRQLAELMLPDQTHVRSQDWTTFFLHINPVGQEHEGGQSDLHKLDEPPLMYVLSLVNTKHTETAKRGAQVKALAIITRHTFLQVFKPILLLALDEYFRKPTDDTLAEIYNAVNALDLSETPKLSRLERLVLMQSERDDLFLDRFPSNQRDRAISTSSHTSNVSSHLSSLQIEPFTPLSPTMSTFHPLSSPQPHFAAPVLPSMSDTHFFTSSIFYNGITIPIKVPMTSLPETVGDFSLISLINTFSQPASPPYSGHNYLCTSGAQTSQAIVLLNALLAQKRIVILGGSQPSGTVASFVLAACAMASGGTGLLRGFTQRAFPYTDLSKIDDLLTVSGFIAGVTNSVFELHPEWWDVLANIDTRQVIISPELRLESTTSTMPTSFQQGEVSFDGQFMDDLLQSISERASETAIRLKFRDFLLRIMKLAELHEIANLGKSALSISTFSPSLSASAASAVRTSQSHSLRGYGPVFSDDNHKRRELAQNAARLDAWIGTESYRCAVIEKRAQSQSKNGYPSSSLPSSRITTMDVSHQFERLKMLKLSHQESMDIFIALNASVSTDSHIIEILSLAPPSSGGLEFLAIGLFHADSEAQSATVDLFRKIREHPVGRFFFEALLRIYRATYARLTRGPAMDQTQ